MFGIERRFGIIGKNFFMQQFKPACFAITGFELVQDYAVYPGIEFFIDFICRKGTKHPQKNILGYIHGLFFGFTVRKTKAINTVLIPLYYLSKDLLGTSYANLPGLLFILIPSFLLTPLYLDQGLYPLLFTVGVLAALQILKTKAAGWGFAAGVIAYLAIFFSFSLLPLIPVMLLWIGLDYLVNLKQISLVKTIKVILIFCLGFFIMHLLFKLLLNYDFILRYQNALAQHRLHKDYLSGVQQIKDAAVLNNTEFATWLGFPVVFLFISAIGRTVKTCFQRNADRKDTLLVAFLITFIVLNLMGQTRSEVARLWLFMVPIVSFFASTEARFLLSGLFNENKRITYGFLYLIILQLGTTFLTFKYQDLD